MKDWIIRKLGGVPQDEHARELRRYANFGRDLAAQLREVGACVPPEGSHIEDVDLGSLVLVEDRITVKGCSADRLGIAPWVKRCVVSDCIVRGPWAPL